ncbi:MAG: DUF2344 domain-containing protein [Planctomycetes bacterium]|nr:DUF2344 domain-containing protein [Planctomycetota bacterium]
MTHSQFEDESSPARGAPAPAAPDASQSQTKQRIRFRFSKAGDIRFISHLDLLRLFERGLRRAGLPVAFSEGFNPRPRISCPLSLGTGIAGREEVVEFRFTERLDPHEAARRLSEAMPAGIAFHAPEEVRPGDHARVVEVHYEVAPRSALGVEQEELDALMARATAPVTVTRGGRTATIDARAHLVALTAAGDVIQIVAAVGSAGSARPEHVLRALGRPFGRGPLFMTRTRVILAPQPRREHRIRPEPRKAGDDLHDSRRPPSTAPPDAPPRAGPDPEARPVTY